MVWGCFRVWDVRLWTLSPGSREYTKRDCWNTADRCKDGWLSTFCEQDMWRVWWLTNSYLRTFVLNSFYFVFIIYLLYFLRFLSILKFIKFSNLNRFIYIYICALIFTIFVPKLAKIEELFFFNNRKIKYQLSLVNKIVRQREYYCPTKCPTTSWISSDKSEGNTGSAIHSLEP